MSDGTPRRRTRRRPSEGMCLVPGCDTEVRKYHKWLCALHADEAEWDERLAMKAQCLVADMNMSARQPGLLSLNRQAEATRDAQAAHPGFVYYLRVGGHYKIGWAKQLASRLKSYPPDGQVLAVHEGSRSDEGALHRRFAHLTTAGREWYPLSTDITRHITLMVDEHGAPDPALRCGPKPTQVRRPNVGRNGPSPRYWTGKRSA